MNDYEMLDVTPSPAILATLTYNQLAWSDALCELIDNAIDSFAKAEREGVPISDPCIELFIPSQADVVRRQGYFLVRDNGPGLDSEGLQNALRAGYSTNQRYGALGLFGVGFNIATGKIGQRTTVTTARSIDDFALEATLDLKEMQDRNTFDAPTRPVPKPDGFVHGTMVRIERWWPSGSPNADFAGRIARQSQSKVLALLGRRYASILRSEEGHLPVRILVYQSADSEPDSVLPFEHCVWSSERFVDSNWGPIPARISIDETLGSHRRCLKDGTRVPDEMTHCPACGGSRLRTIVERVYGWVGIQRYDDINEYGIDIIRNGRTIRTGEKDAFFYWTEDDGTITKEYPLDDQTGRIVGQIHLDHVPVDFMKQDFERTSPEWERAMLCVRGEQLRERSWRPGYKNESPISLLHHGYKRIREYGRRAMYMGRWDPIRRKAVRIAREVELEYRERFARREPGFYDDAEWWKLVESADVPPPAASEECPECHFTHSPEDEVCLGCGKVFRGKPCISCRTEIPASARVCDTCGESQIVDLNTTWTCSYCVSQNSPDEVECATCGLPFGHEHPTSSRNLEAHSTPSDELTREGLVIELANGLRCDPIAVVTSITQDQLRPRFDGPTVPAICVKSANEVRIFIDEAHPVFTDLNMRPVDLVVTECAQYLYSHYGFLQGQPGHSISAIAAALLIGGWETDVSVAVEGLNSRINSLFDEISNQLADVVETAEFYSDLSAEQQQRIAAAIYDAGHGSELGRLIATGGFLRFAPRDLFSRYFGSFPEVWLQHVWNLVLPSAIEVGASEAEARRNREVATIDRCLMDCVCTLDAHDATKGLQARANSAIEYLESVLR